MFKLSEFIGIGPIGLGLNGMVPALCFGEVFLLPFWGTTFFHCSVVPVLIIFPRVSSVGDESVSFLFFSVVLGICRNSLIEVENEWASRRVFGTTDSPLLPGSF